MTAKEAVQQLEHEGLVYRRRGSGTYVSGSSILPPASQLSPLFSSIPLDTLEDGLLKSRLQRNERQTMEYLVTLSVVYRARAETKKPLARLKKLITFQILLK